MIDYNDQIQLRVEKYFDIIIGVTSCIAFIASFFLYKAELPLIYALLNLITAVILFIVFIFAKKLSASFKIIITIILTLIIAVASFIGGTFSSPFMSIFIVSNVLAVLFLPVRRSLFVSFISMIIMFGLAYYSIKIDIYSLMTYSVYTWSLQIIGIILLLVVLNISAYSIKNYLIENILELKEAVGHSNKLAYYDQLTQLPNTYKFMLDVNEAIKKDRSNGFIVFLNIRSLGLINSTLGHKAGDQALIDTKDIFLKMKNEKTYIARIGGNEFAIWISDISEDEFIEKFHEIMDSIKFESSKVKKKLEIYAAYSLFTFGVDMLEDCYQRTELTLTYVKNNNILKLMAYNDDLEKELRRKENIKDLIEDAIANEDIELYYQAKYNSKTNEIVGVEGLARWNSSEIGFVSPVEFIPIIETLNMSIKFGNYVIEQVAKDYKKLKEKYNENITVSINISPTHIVEPNIIKVISNTMKKYDVPLNKIILEITEEVIIEGIDKVRPILKELMDMNIKISLDDFGSGYSSLSYLAKLYFHEIKIDKTFIDQIGENKLILFLIANIINLAQEFDLDIIAEGVETKEQKDVLNDLGCYIIQGYYYARPEAL